MCCRYACPYLRKSQSEQRRVLNSYEIIIYLQFYFVLHIRPLCPWQRGRMFDSGSFQDSFWGSGNFTRNIDYPAGK
jgi:hypothetical protein